MKYPAISNKNKRKKVHQKFIETVFEFEIVIVFLIGLGLYFLHIFGRLEEFASTSMILIFLSLLTFHVVLNNLKQNEFIERIRNISEDTFIYITKFLEAYDLGFRQIHEKRECFIENALYDKITSSKKFTRIIAICLTELREKNTLSENYINLVVNKIVEIPKYKFQFFLLKPDLYSQRAKIEESNVDDLRRYRNVSLFSLLWIKSKIYYKTKKIEDIKRVRIKEYDIMPTVSEFFIDDTIYYGPYLARKCADIPMVEIKKTSDKSKADLYKLFEENYDRMNNLSYNLTFKIHYEYLFGWDKVPGDEDGKLIQFLRQRYDIDGIEKDNIEKNDSNRAIKIITDDNFLSLRLNDEKTKVNVEICGGRTDEFIAKTKNGELNIYHSIEEDFDSILSTKIEGIYKIEKIYDILQNEEVRDKYYRKIIEQKDFEDILKDIDTKISLDETRTRKNERK